MQHPNEITLGSDSRFAIVVKRLPAGTILLVQGETILVVPEELVYSLVTTMGNWVQID